MNNQEVKQEVLRLIKTLPVCKPDSRNIQWVVRCPYCGDSSDPTHGHFSIKIDMDSDSPMVYRCFKCEERGVITATVLQDLGCGYDSDLAESLKAYNKSSISNSEKYNTRNLSYIAPLNTNPEHDKKKQYLNQRFGLDLSYEDYRDMKVVFDIFEFMHFNSIKAIPNVSWKFLKFINMNYVGFLTNNNAKIIWRCIRKDESMHRYTKMNLDPNNVSVNNFYMIPNVIDLTYTTDMHVHIAEGTFDIISVYYNVMNQKKENQLYYAAAGFNYNTIISYLLNIGICTDIILHIYSDSDKSDRDHLKYLSSNRNRIWIKEIYIHRNLYPGEKDYGVPKSRIQHSSYLLPI